MSIDSKPRGRLTAGALTAALAVPLLLSGAAQAQPAAGPGSTGRPGGTVVTADEQDCFEVAIPRGVVFSALRARVPARYGLEERQPTDLDFTTGTVYIVNTDCTVSVDGHPAGRATATYLVAPVTARDGQPGGVYVLAHGVSHPELAARYRAAGFPTRYQPDTDATETVDPATGTATMTWTVSGAGLDHSLTARGPAALDGGEQITGVARYYHDGPLGDLVLTFDNRLLVSLAAVSADFTTSSELASLIARPRNLTIMNPRPVFTYVRGEWTSELARLSGS